MNDTKTEPWIIRFIKSNQNWVYKTFVTTGIGALLIMLGSLKEQFLQTTFSSPEMKIKTEQYINFAPNEVDTYIAYRRLDSLTKAWHRQQEEDREHRHNQDILINNNINSIREIKENLQKYGTIQEEQTKILKEISNKIKP